MAKTGTVDPPTDIEGVSRELRRFQLLVRLFERHRGYKMPEVAKRTGIDYSHLTKLMKPQGGSYTGLSADIVRKMRDGLQISPDFIFDDQLAPVRDEADLLNVYSLDETRKKQWMQRMERRMLDVEQFKVEAVARMLELQAQLERKENEILRLKHELEKAQAAASRPRTRPTK
jgi:transcriptional regulator with XRE-family HTH domain